MILLLFWGTFEDLITYVVFTDWIFFGLTAASIFVFRVKRKDLQRPYKTLGYPIVPLIFISITFLFVLNTLLKKPVHAYAGLIFLLIALPVFYFFKKQRDSK